MCSLFGADVVDAAVLDVAVWCCCCVCCLLLLMLLCVVAVVADVGADVVV